MVRVKVINFVKVRGQSLSFVTLLNMQLRLCHSQIIKISISHFIFVEVLCFVIYSALFANKLVI